jgi:hypothetical protein
MVTTLVAPTLLPQQVSTYGVSSCSTKLARLHHQALGPAVVFASIASRDACVLDLDGSLSGRVNNYVYSQTQLLLGDYDCKPLSPQIGGNGTCQCLLGTVCATSLRFGVDFPLHDAIGVPHDSSQPFSL